MKRQPIYAFEKRTFLNPASTHLTSYIQVHVEPGHEAPYKWGDNMVIIADCKRAIHFEFFLGTRKARCISLAKINLLIDVLTQFRDAPTKEIALIEKPNSGKDTLANKTPGRMRLRPPVKSPTRLPFVSSSI